MTLRDNRPPVLSLLSIWLLFFDSPVLYLPNPTPQSTKYRMERPLFFFVHIRFFDSQVLCLPNPILQKTERPPFFFIHR